MRSGAQNRPKSKADKQIGYINSKSQKQIWIGLNQVIILLWRGTPSAGHDQSCCFSGGSIPGQPEAAAAVLGGVNFAPSSCLLRQRNSKHFCEILHKSIFGPISIFCFSNLFVNCGVLGWIRIDFALLMVLQKVQRHIFFQIFTFLGNLSFIWPLLLIPS